MGLQTNVERLGLKEVPLIQLAALLSEMSGYNIVVTRDAADTKVSLYVQNLPLRQALESVCRLNGLWYREDSRIITLMTTEEYGKEMVVRRNEKSRAYWLRYTNANDMAKILQAVMGSQVVFNDIGKEEVYGHVDEEKKAGTRVTVDDENTDTRALNPLKDLQGFSEEEVRKLLSLQKLKSRENNALELSKEIEKKVPAIITVFKRNNSIIARSLDESVLEEIGRVIELMDTPTHQVLLEISILQLSLGEGFESFFDLDFPGSYEETYPDNLYTYNSSGSAPTWSPDKGYYYYDENGDEQYAQFDYAGRTITYAASAVADTMASSAGLASTTFNVLFGTESIQARLELYENEDRVEVLATPYLMSANNSKVEFFVGQEVPLRDDVESKTLYDSDGNVTTTNFEVSIKREELGTDIEISSFINEDGTITMDLEAEISSPQYNITTIGVVSDATGSVVQFPLDGKETSELNSVVTAVSGQPIAIGGIIREELSEYEKKVPVLGDIPGLGFLFKEISDATSKTETVILLTPHIIKHPALAWKESREFLKRRSSHPHFVRDQENITEYPTRDMYDKEKKSDESAVDPFDDK